MTQVYFKKLKKNPYLDDFNYLKTSEGLGLFKSFFGQKVIVRF